MPGQRDFCADLTLSDFIGDAVDMPQEIWRQFCSFLLHPLLSENLVTLKDADELRKQINWAKPRRPEITFSNADHYRASIKPAVFREVFCDVSGAPIVQVGFNRPSITDTSVTSATLAIYRFLDTIPYAV